MQLHCLRKLNERVGGNGCLLAFQLKPPLPQPTGDPHRALYLQFHSKYLLLHILRACLSVKQYLNTKEAVVGHTTINHV